VTPSIDITAKQRKTVLALLQRHLPGATAWAYGSRVTWKSRPQSDLDLVVFAKPDQARHVAALKEAFEESKLPFRVDLFVWDEVPDTFKINIEAEHVVLQEAEDECRGLGSEWCQMTWGELISLEYGKRLQGYKDAKGPVRVYGSNGAVGWTAEPLAPGPGVILGRKGACRGVEYSRYPFFVIDTAYYVKPKVKADVRWLYYAIKHHKLGEIDDGSPIPSTTRSAVYVRPLDFPPLDVQRRIAHILGTLDDKIELNRQMNRTLERIAAAIFKSWFIDFDPVHAKAEGRDPGLPQHIAALFPNSFEDSDLGPIPEGWDVKPIGKAVRCVGGATPSTKKREFWEGGTHPFVTPKDMSSLQSPVILGSKRRITDAGVEKISSGQLPVGTVILSSRAPIGYLGLAAVPVSVNQGVIAMICDGDLPNQYVLHWTTANMDLIKSRAGGTTFAEISKRNFRPIPVLVPTKPVLDTFMERVVLLHRRVWLNVRQDRRLAELRDTLLPKLLSGEIDESVLEQVEVA